MTRDEVIRMAQEIWGKSDWNDAQTERLERFVALVEERVAATERDLLGALLWMEEYFRGYQDADGHSKAMFKKARAAIAKATGE